MKFFLILGNQLFDPKYLKNYRDHSFFICEDYGLCTYEKHHKLKILMFLAAMREKRDEFQAHGFTVEYVAIDHPKFDQPYEEKLAACILELEITSLTVFEIEDKEFEARMQTFAAEQNLSLTVLPSPMFLLEREEFVALNKKFKALRMGNFYKEVRKKLNVLMDQITAK